MLAKLVICVRHWHKMSNQESASLIVQLIRWAEKNKKSQADIGRRLGVDRQRVSSWFRGERIPSLENGLRIQRLIKKKSR